MKDRKPKSDLQQSEITVTSSDSVGPYLKKSREAQGLSLDQVASLTRIQSKFLQALEDEEFQKLPEQVFTRGFVRTYARSLGVDEEDTLRRFSESSSAFYHQGQQAQNQANLQLQQEQRGKLNRNLVIVVTIVIIVALGFLLPRQQQSSPPPPGGDSNSSPEVTLPSPVSPVSPNQEKTVEVTTTPNLTSSKTEDSSIDSLEPKPLPPSTTSLQNPIQEVPKQKPTPSVSISTDPIRLEIEATQLTWVVVQSDSDSPQEALLQPAQKGTWEARQQFTLTLGNAAGVEVKLNGESRGPFGKPGQVVREVVLKP